MRWPSTEGDNEKFWKHEWEKHGTCALDKSPLKSQFLYFQQALKWNQKYDIGQFLRKHGINPNDEKKYQFSDIRNAIETELGTSVNIICQYNKVRSISYF